MLLTSPKFDDEELNLVKQCLDSGWVTQGPFVEKFEKAICATQNVEHAMATTSCTAALHMATTALGLGPGDEVIVPAFTWVTSAFAAEYVGAKVVFADIDPATYNIDPQSIKRCITPNTRAIIVVHLFGLAAEMDQIMEIAKANELVVIEDAACAIGTRYKGVKVGGIGDVGCFSFHPRKVVTTGEGGAVTTNSPDIADAIRILRNHGSSGLRLAQGDEAKPYSMAHFETVGFNLRLSDIQAAVGVAQMNKLDDLLAERRKAALLYNELLADVDELALPVAGDASGHSYQSYVISVLKGGRKKRNAIMDALARNGIQSRPGTHAVHNLGWYVENHGFVREDFPVASNAEDTTITLPIFPGIVKADQDRVVSIILSTI
ncbi:MAG: glutamine--scyllo-inositol aminotransferase [Rhodospirillaceae bacterium]|nr:MAG: glutamine--scyllo-inositol aminotransferase [Rhodospirillaceae bacterium]